MKISTHILCARLAESFPFKTIGAVGGELVLERPLFLSDQSPLLNHHIYIMDKTFTCGAPVQKTDSVLLYVGALPEGLSDCFRTTLVFEEGLSIFNLHNKVQAIYSEHEEWDFELQRILRKNGNIQEMIDCCTHVIENPVLLLSKDCTITVVSSKFRNDPRIRELLEDKKINAHFDAAGTGLAKDGSALSTRENTGSITAVVNGVRILFLNMYFQGWYVYRLLIVETNRELMPSDGPQLEHLGNYIQSAFNANWVSLLSERLTLQQILTGILSGETPDQDDIEKRLKPFGWERQHQFYCLKILPEKPGLQSGSLNILCEKLMGILPGACILEYEKHLTIFINTDMALLNENTFGVLERFLGENNMKAGVSNRFAGLSSFELYYRQAGYALSVGMRYKPGASIHRFQDIADLFVLESCFSQLPAEVTCAPEILKLRQYDEEHHTEYGRTLSIFLKNNLHHVMTAKELFIHRSTFQYRLKRIHEITGIDMDNCDKQWYLALSIKLLEMTDK